MSVYLDASVLVSLFLPDSNSRSALQRIRRMRETLIVSDFAAAEFASGVAKRVRTRESTRADAHAAFAEFDDWVARSADHTELTSADIGATTRLLRRLDSTLRTPDALHVALVQRIGARLFTLDARMKAFAKQEGIGVV